MQLRNILVSLAIVVLFLTACSKPTLQAVIPTPGCLDAECNTKQPELVITTQGCSSDLVRLSPDHQPFFTLESRAKTPIVVTVPAMNRWMVVQPGAQLQFELPRYIMGSFDYFCVDEAEHTRLGGDNPYVCAMEPDDLAPVALSQGVLVIEPHNRIEEVIGR